MALATALATCVGASSASAIEVNSLADPGNNNCNDGTCTLREAMDLADSTLTTPDTITFKSGLSGTINLDGTAGQLSAYSPMSIQGPGPSVVTISGDSNANGSPDVRTLYVFSDDFSLSGLTFSKGAGKPDIASPTGKGGAIYFFGSTASLNDVVVTGSSLASNSGGGIWAGDSALTITSSSIVGNHAAARGGGIAAEEVMGSHPQTLTVRDSVVAGNDADYGGGIQTSNLESTRIERSTITGNEAGTYGGGGMTSVGPATIENSTIAGNNSDAGGGGGGWTFGLTSTGSRLVDSTVAGNSASYAGGVLASSPSVGQLTIAGAIVADNGAEDLLAVGGPKFTVADSLLEHPEASSFTQAPGSANIIGSDPQLGPLASNGGPTPTMLIAPTSPAVDAGRANGLSTDQRGLARTVDQPGMGAPGSDGTDIGAVELGDGTGPDLDARRKGKTKAGKTLKIVVSSDEAATVEAAATAKAGKKKVQFRGASGDVGAGGSVTLKLKLAKKPAKVLKKAGKGKATVSIVATDGAGNESSDSLRLKLK